MDFNGFSLPERRHHLRNHASGLKRESDFVFQAKGVIRPTRLGDGVHYENQAVGRVVPLNLLADAAGYEMVQRCG
jgi:hypothetical protein